MNKTMTTLMFNRNCSVPGVTRRILSSLGLALLTFAAQRTRAIVPIPDQIGYGTIAISNLTVTNNAAGTNVVIEAHRASDGQLLASYTMGTSTSQRDLFYVLRVPMEDAPASAPSFAQPNDPLIFTVKQLDAVQFTSTNYPAESGVAFRLDFGASPDAHKNGAPDGWELQYFGSSGHDLSQDTDHDGVSDLAEYIAGTSPVDPNDVFRLYSQSTANEELQISFYALAAQGVGYEGRTRYYALETASNLAPDSWQTVPNYGRIQGANKTVTYTASPNNGNSPAFFRARVWLEGPQ
jgi:hypothetical protein